MANPRDPFEDLSRHVLDIQERNARVEREKAWETSWTRRLVITVAIWLVACGWLFNLDVRHAALHALVPGLAYLLSTLSLPIVRRWWMRKRFK